MIKIPCGGFYIDEESLEINDNILKVKNGSGGGIFLITATSDGNTYSADKTFAEIKAACEDGQLPVLYDDYSKQYFYMHTGNDFNGAEFHTLLSLDSQSGMIYGAVILIASDNSVTYYPVSITIE